MTVADTCDEVAQLGLARRQRLTSRDRRPNDGTRTNGPRFGVARRSAGPDDSDAAAVCVRDDDRTGHPGPQAGPAIGPHAGAKRPLPARVERVEANGPGTMID